MNAVSQWGLTILNGLIGVLLVPFLITQLDKAGYGLISVIISITTIALLVDMGVSEALARCLAEAQAQQDNDRYNKFLNTGVVIYVAVGIAAAVLIAVVAPALVGLFNVPDEMFATAVSVLRIYGAGHILTVLASASAMAVLKSHHRFDRVYHVQAGRQIVMSLALFAVLGLTDAGLVGWAMVAVSADFVVLLGSWWMAFREHAGLSVSPRLFRPAMLKQIYGLGGQLAALQISGQLSTNANPFVLTYHLGPASVALYQPSFKIAELLRPFVMALSSQLAPLATASHVQKNLGEMQSILFRGTKMTLLLGAIAFAVMFSLAYPICEVWLGDSLGEEYTRCAQLLMIMAGIQLGLYAAGTQWPILIGVKRLHFTVMGRIIIAVTNFVLAWILVGYTSLGVLGVSLPMLATEWIWRPLIARHTCKLIQVSTWAYFRHAYLRPLLIALVLTGLGFALQQLVAIDTLARLAGAASLIALAGLALAWFVGMDTEDRARVRAMASRRRAPAGATEPLPPEPGENHG